jgi:hypothetical protein
VDHNIPDNRVRRYVSGLKGFPKIRGAYPPAAYLFGTQQWPAGFHLSCSSFDPCSTVFISKQFGVNEQRCMILQFYMQLADRRGSKHLKALCA